MKGLLKVAKKDRKKCLMMLEADRQLLEAQQITVCSPGPILGDIEILLDFIGTAGLSTKSHEGNLPSPVLPELNTRLSQPIAINLNRPLLRKFPNIAGLYILLRVMGLVRVEPTRVRVSEKELAAWSSLNPTEQYFALMEAWLLLAEDSVLGRSRAAGLANQFKEILLFLGAAVSSDWTSYDEWIHRTFGGVRVLDWNAQLMARFGLIEVRPRSVEDRRSIASRGWIMERARLTPWGSAVRLALISFLGIKNIQDLVFYHPPEDAAYGFLRPAFQPYFSELQRAYAPVQAAFRPGLHIFKVSLGRIWRRLAVPAHNTLEDLAQAILSAFDFDDDHLYDFKYRDQLGKAREFNHPFSREGPYTSEIQVGQTLLPEKDTMNFLYDYGDCWQFSARLERIEPPAKRVRRPKVIGSAGEAPEQYPDAEEGW